MYAVMKHSVFQIEKGVLVLFRSGFAVSIAEMGRYAMGFRL